MPAETLANINRGRFRGWVGIAAVLLVVLAVLSWPYLLGVVAFLAVAVVCAIVQVWVYRNLPDSEKQPDGEPDSDTGRLE